MYYVRCNTRSSGASARGTPRQALDYITDAHDAERDPSYSHAELAYIARLDPGWKTDLEGGRVPLVGLGALAGFSDHTVLAAEFEQACQPYHDRRGTTGYLSYTFTMPKELSLVAEGHPVKAREAMYAALQSSLDTAFTGKEYRAVTAIHTRNEAGEVHYHAHVLIGKFARDSASGRVFSLNSRSGGNTGKVRLKALKHAWKDSLDAALKDRLGLTVMQSSPFARPALTLADGTYVPALNRESRRILDKHLCFRLSETSPSGATKTKNFRWTHFDPTIYELASSRRAGGWSATVFCELFPEIAGRLRTYESRVATLKRIGYLTTDGRVTDAFTLHYRVHKGDHPELQRLRADLHKLARVESKTPGRGGGGGAPPGGFRPPPQSAREPDSSPPAPSPEDEDVELWLVLHRHQRLLNRLERLGVSPADFKRIHQEARRSRPSPETLQQLRAQAKQQDARVPVQPRLPKTSNIIRAYCGVYKAQVMSFFVISKGLLTLRLGEHAALAERMRQRARLDYQLAKERKLGLVARRLRPLFLIGRIVMPHEVNRLELALRRCNQLAARENAETIYREKRARAYRNSRDALITQLREEARKSAFRGNPELAHEEQDLRHKVAHSASRVDSSASNTRPVAHLRAGLEVLRVHRPRDYARLLPWRGRESELIAAFLARAKERAPFSKEQEAALLAGRVGHLLQKERAASATDVPPCLADYAREVNLANARLHAAGAPPPFSAEALWALPVATIRRALDSLREAGLLTEGPGWTLRVASAFPVAERVRKQISLDLDSDKEAQR